jgi:hypothetical protein
VSVSIAFGLLLALLVLILKFHRQITRSFSFLLDRSSSGDTADVEKLLQKYGSLAPKRYRYAELKRITKSFQRKLG